MDIDGQGGGADREHDFDESRLKSVHLGTSRGYGPNTLSRNNLRNVKVNSCQIRPFPAFERQKPKVSACLSMQFNAVRDSTLGGAFAPPRIPITASDAYGDGNVFFWRGPPGVLNCFRLPLPVVSMGNSVVTAQ